MLSFKHEFTGNGQHRLVCGDKVGEWTHYRGIACLQVGDEKFIAVTAYFEGDLPHKTAMKIETFPTETAELTAPPMGATS